MRNKSEDGTKSVAFETSVIIMYFAGQGRLKSGEAKKLLALTASAKTETHLDSVLLELAALLLRNTAPLFESFEPFKKDGDSPMTMSMGITNLH